MAGGTALCRGGEESEKAGKEPGTKRPKKTKGKEKARPLMIKVMKYVHAAPARGFEIVTGTCFTVSVKRLHGSTL